LVLQFEYAADCTTAV